MIKRFLTFLLLLALPGCANLTLDKATQKCLNRTGSVQYTQTDDVIEFRCNR